MLNAIFRLPIPILYPADEAENERVWIVATEVAAGEPKEHHYVPAMYLRGFTGAKGQLFSIDRPSEKWFRTAPENVAKKKNFNRIDVEGMDPNAVEKVLSEFEGEVAPALERIKLAKSLAVEADRSLLVNFMAAIALRNPRRRKDFEEIISLAKGKDFADRFGTKEKFEATVAKMKADGAWNENTAITFEDLQTPPEDMFAASKEEVIMAEIGQHDHLTEQLWHRKWQTVVAGEDSGGFVTTDDPVCLRWADEEAHGGLSPGFAVPRTEVIFPLSTKLALRGTFDGEENVLDVDAAAVAKLNSLIIRNAEHQVYAHDHSFKFMRGKPEELGSGATLLQDERFLAAGKPKEKNIVALRTK